MFAFEVKDMTCGHCASMIAKALKSADTNAKVSIDLAKHLVTIEAPGVDESMLRDAIAEAGYTPVLVEAAAVDTVGQNGSCCGRCS